MRLKHLVFKDTGSVLTGLAVTVSKLLFSLCPSSPVMGTHKAPSLHLSAWQSQGVSEPFQHLPRPNEGAEPFNCLFYVYTLPSSESSDKKGA